MRPWLWKLWDSGAVLALLIVAACVCAGRVSNPEEAQGRVPLIPAPRPWFNPGISTGNVYPSQVGVTNRFVPNWEQTFPPTIEGVVVDGLSVRETPLTK